MRDSTEVAAPRVVDEALRPTFETIGRVLAARWPYGRSPFESRRALRKVFAETAKLAGLDGHPYLAILFGSLARGEHARDADILIVMGTAGVARHYWRFEAVEGSVDFNVANRAWLREAWRDPEWGYCLTEGYAIGSTDGDLERQWMDGVRSYWTPGAVRLRLRAHRMAYERLSEAADVASGRGAHLMERLLRHEAVRSAGCGLIERFGTRVYSHRSFLSEMWHAGRRAGVPVATVTATIAGLTPGSLTSRRAAAVHYVQLRQYLSLLLRPRVLGAVMVETGMESLLPLTREERTFALSQLVAGDGIYDLETTLAGVGAGDLLPASSRLVVAHHAAAILLERAEKGAGAATTSRAVLQSPTPTSRATVPVKAPLEGARWVESVGDRLKLIVSTGGCRTPTCRFCALPSYAGKWSRPPAETVSEALRRFRPRELALYNDGSLLNPAEVSPEDLIAVCRTVRDHSVERLWIESIPRFVTNEIIDRLRAETSVLELGVGMGLQCVANRIAMFELGRPDSTGVFDRAIDVLQESDALVRIYLLWGYGSLAGPEAPDLLASSLRWARARRPLMVTICPYVSPLPHSTLAFPIAGAALCDLRGVLESTALHDDFHVSVALADIPSCGTAYTGTGCPACHFALRTRRWRAAPRCERRSR